MIYANLEEELPYHQVYLIQLFFLQNRIAPKTSFSFPLNSSTVYDFRQFVYSLVYNIDKFPFRENKVLIIRHIRMQKDFDIRILTDLN